VVTDSFDQTARVWDAQSGLPVTPPMQHRSRVCQAAFSPDGRRVITANWNQTARIWDLPLDQRPIEDWRHLAELVTAGRMDVQGAFTPLSATELGEAWHILRTKYPKDFAISPRQLSKARLKEETKK
jgi:WD40 repeat protein